MIKVIAPFHIWEEASYRYMITNAGFQVSMEAVSPILLGAHDSLNNIERFWLATRSLFNVQRNTSCGTHIHVAPRERHYTLSELKDICHNILIDEKYVLKILPKERLENSYCRPNSPFNPITTTTNFIWDAKSPEDLISGIQGETRHVLWKRRDGRKWYGRVPRRSACPR